MAEPFLVNPIGAMGLMDEVLLLNTPLKRRAKVKRKTKKRVSRRKVSRKKSVSGRKRHRITAYKERSGLYVSPFSKLAPRMASERTRIAALNPRLRSIYEEVGTMKRSSKGLSAKKRRKPSKKRRRVYRRNAPARARILPFNSVKGNEVAGAIGGFIGAAYLPKILPIPITMKVGAVGIVVKAGTVIGLHLIAKNVLKQPGVAKAVLLGGLAGVGASALDQFVFQGKLGLSEIGLEAYIEPDGMSQEPEPSDDDLLGGYLPDSEEEVFEDDGEDEDDDDEDI